MIITEKKSPSMLRHAWQIIYTSIYQHGIIGQLETGYPIVALKMRSTYTDRSTRFMQDIPRYT